MFNFNPFSHMFQSCPGGSCQEIGGTTIATRPPRWIEISWGSLRKIDLDLQRTVGCCDSFHHDDIRTWKRIPHYWCFVRGIQRSPVDSPDQGLIMQSFSLLLAWISCWTDCGANWWFEMPWSSCDVTIMAYSRVRLTRACFTCELFNEINVFLHAFCMILRNLFHANILNHSRIRHAHTDFT